MRFNNLPHQQLKNNPEARPRILMVDDTPTNIKVLTGILRNDYDLISAFNGTEALELARTEKPDLILLDVLMPGMDGFRVCEELKANHLTRSIPVIFVTALEEVADETRGFELGAVDYLTKPIRKPIVKARVRNHLELKQHRDFLERLSTLDGLTGIPNRRHFDAFAEGEWRRSIRKSSHFSLLLIDVDHFKMFNDRYGHLEGDDCLRDVAQALLKTPRRPMDFVARFGGEEFAVVLPDTDMEGAKLLAESMRKAIEDLKIPHAGNSSCGHVTVSVGIASTKPEMNDELGSLLKEADEALYKAKETGRNRVVG